MCGTTEEPGVPANSELETSASRNVINLVWKIEDFRLRQNDWILVSPVFISNEGGESHWRLELYPNGVDNQYEGFFTVFLRLVFCKTDISPGKYKFSILNAARDQVHSAWAVVPEKFETEKSYGFRRFIKREFILNHDNSYSDGSLTVCCEVFPDVESLKFSNPVSENQLQKSQNSSQSLNPGRGFSELKTAFEVFHCRELPSLSNLGPAICNAAETVHDTAEEAEEDDWALMQQNISQLRTSKPPAPVSDSIGSKPEQCKLIGSPEILNPLRLRGPSMPRNHLNLYDMHTSEVFHVQDDPIIDGDCPSMPRNHSNLYDMHTSEVFHVQDDPIIDGDCGVEKAEKGSRLAGVLPRIALQRLKVVLSYLRKTQGYEPDPELLESARESSNAAVCAIHAAYAHLTAQFMKDGLEVFTGKEGLGSFSEWWLNFSVRIHDCQDLDDASRLMVLMKSITGDARKTVDQAIERSRGPLYIDAVNSLFSKYTGRSDSGQEGKVSRSRFAGA